GGRDNGAGQTDISIPWNGHNRIRIDDARVWPALSGSRRPQSGRVDPGASLFQAARVADLARCGRDGNWWCAVAVRSPFAGRGAKPGWKTGQSRGRPAASGVGPMRFLQARILQAIVVGLTLLLSQQVLAVQPDEVLNDPVLEQRARGLSKELRCMVCQN